MESVGSVVTGTSEIFRMSAISNNSYSNTHILFTATFHQNFCHAVFLSFLRRNKQFHFAKAWEEILQ